MSAALRSFGFLDVLDSTPAESSRRAPCTHARLHRLATKPREKSGLTTKHTKNTKLDELYFVCFVVKSFLESEIIVAHRPLQWLVAFWPLYFV